MDTATHDRRVVIQHEDSMTQIVGIWPAAQAVPAVLNVRDEWGRARVVRLVSVDERYIKYRTEPLVGTEVATSEI